MTEKVVSEQALLSQTLNELPDRLDKDVEEAVCKLMCLVTTPAMGDREAMKRTEEAAREMVRLMHTSMHESPRLVAVIATNCLVMMEVMLQASGQTPEQRLTLHANMLGVASKIATTHIKMMSGTDTVH